MDVTKIFGADVCRDGGSYSLSFESSDSEWYEFFVQVKGVESNEYFEPVIYKNGFDSGELVEQLNWSNAGKFLASLKYDNARFYELVTLVENRGST
ncbi:hypothetical protein [Enterovibrio norvegicus]|uniref:hypothetical protein n=1 Tax=Enterovibrio norvegicus TaxID=188144 RepID=UPI0024B1E00B|nr:hypothetical protein [Enterovibrio norvegicus]